MAVIRKLTMTALCISSGWAVYMIWGEIDGALRWRRQGSPLP